MCAQFLAPSDCIWFELFGIGNGWFSKFFEIESESVQHCLILQLELESAGIGVIWSRNCNQCNTELELDSLRPQLVLVYAYNILLFVLHLTPLLSSEKT